VIGNPNIGQAPQKGGWLKNMIPALAGALPVVGGIAQGVIAGMNTRAANKYNSPEQQIKRAKAAHLPAASINNISAGNQSAVTPSTDYGTASAGKEIGQYNQNQRTIKEIGRLTEDIHRMKLENKKLAGELEWYLGNAGTDPARTNLSNVLGLEARSKALGNINLDATGQINIANAGNIGTKIDLENKEQKQRIGNMITTNLATETQIEGAKLNNAIREIDLKYHPGMKAAEYDNILKRNGILVTEKGLKDLELSFNQDTYKTRVHMVDLDRALKSWGEMTMGRDYAFNKQYQDLASQARNLFQFADMPISERLKAISGLMYTTIASPGGHTGVGNILGLMK